MKQKLLMICLTGWISWMGVTSVQSQISVSMAWEHKWTPTGGTDPIGFDSIVLPITPTRFGCAELADLNGDGKKDLISGGNRGDLYFYKNVGTLTAPHYQASNDIPSLDSIHIGQAQNTNEVRVRFADLDNDNDLDMLVGSRWNYPGFHKLDDFQYYQNIGSATNPIFTHDTIPGLQFQQVGEFNGFAFGDLDGDDDLDIVAGGSDSCTYFRNDGTITSPSYTRVHTLFPPSMWVETSFLAPTPDLEDFDEDGDLDIYFMNEAGFIRYFPNYGTPTAPDYAPYTSYPAHSFDTLDFGAFGSISFEDIDGDDVKDLVASHWNPTAWYWSKGISPNPIISFSPTNVDCNGNSTGAVSASVSNGATPFTYLWSTGGTSNSLSSLSAGNYTLTVTDSLGNVGTNTATITEPSILAPVASTTSNISCNGAGDGQANVVSTGGTTPYTYSWSNGAITASVSGLGVGTYTVTLTDANGCTGTSSTSVTEPTTLSASATNTSPTSNVATDGSATASGSGGTSPYTYSWSNAGTTATINSLAIGTYTVTLSDANACTATATTTLTANPAPSFTVDSNASCNGFTDGGATVSVTGGTAPFTYLWSNSATTTSITGVAAGTYTVTVTDNTGLTGTNSTTITEPAILVAASVVDSNITCNGFSDGGATSSATGGTMPYTYSWNNSATTASITGVTAGTYSVTVTDANGCTDSASLAITEPTTLAANTTNTSPTSNVAADGSATASGSGGTSPYTYSWSNAGTTATINSLGIGTYTVTLSDANACTTTATTTLTANPAPNFTVDSNASCNGFTDGGATVSVTGGTAPFTYLWSNSATTASITGVAAGTYTVTVTDNTGLTGTNSTTITEPAILVAASVVDSNITCNGFSDGGATSSATGGTMPYTYSWNNSATTASITGVTAGTYSVTVTDANGCTDSASLAISEPAVLVATTIVDSNTTCNGLSDGGASASATGGTAPYTYAWSNSATTASITGVVAGTYSVTVTDANGCTDSSSATITEPNLLVAAATVDSNAACNGFSNGGATASATGGTGVYTYSWSNSATTASITGVVAGTYSVTVTDANGCTDSTSVVITEPTLLVATAVVDSNATCNGFSNGGASASASGGTGAYTYSWSNSATTASITGVAAGTYSVTVTDNIGCTGSASVIITEPTVLVAATVVDSNATCNGFSNGGATASASGGTGAYTYAWSNSATTASITGVVAGTYSVTVTDNNGCTDSTSVVITEPAVLIAATIVDSNTTCNGLSDGGASASATGGTAPYTYAWSNSATTASITGVVAGTYSVTVTDANGCTDASSATITEPNLLVAAATVDSNAACNGFSNGGATASATGGTGVYTYSWSNSATTASITGVVAGTYSVTVTDANGCTDSTSVVITEPTLLVATAVVDSNATCNGFSNGGASASASGGTGAYTYSWSNSATTASITGVAAGTYSVTVTDNNGCTDSASVIITEPTALVAATVVDSNATCNGLSNGGATASAAGGTGAYSYNWSNSATTAAITGVAAGTYSVTVTDNNGCTDSTSVVITEPNVLVAIASLDSNISCNGLSDGGASGTAIGGTLPYAYNWSNGDTTASISGVAAGNYTVTITDQNGCTNDSMVSISEPVVLAVALTVDSNASCNGLSDGGISAAATGGTTAYAYSWSNADTTATLTGIAAGSYTVTITDANGCSDTASASVTEPATLVASIDSVNDVTCDGDSNGAAFGSATGGTMPYVYSWSNGDAGSSSSNLPEGNIGLTVTDDKGCVAMANDNVGFQFNLPIVNLGNDTSVTVSTVVLALPNLYSSYVWSTGGTDSTETISGNGPVWVVVTDSNGCSNSDTVMVSLWPLGIASTATPLEIRAYPNPSRGLVTLETTTQVSESIQWTVVSVTGQQMIGGNWTPAAGQTTTEIDLQNLSAGNYFIRVASEKSVKTIRIVLH